MLDYPGKTAATLFAPGCNLRCPFCHNARLVSALSFPDIPLDDVFAFLGTRAGLLDGVCVSGGEPLLQSDLEDFLERVRSCGFSVKLDTNGTLPRRLETLLDAGLVDYVALDVKNCPERYAMTVGVEGFSARSVEESMRALLSSRTPFELRTTVVAPLHDDDSLLACAHWIEQCAHDTGRAAEDVPWFLQRFADGEGLIGGTMDLTALDDGKVLSLLPRLRDVLPRTRLRGMDEG